MVTHVTQLVSLNQFAVGACQDNYNFLSRPPAPIVYVECRIMRGYFQLCISNILIFGDFIRTFSYYSMHGFIMLLYVFYQCNFIHVLSIHVIIEGSVHE